MAEAAAENIYLESTIEQAQFAYAVPEMAVDELIRQRAAHFIGSVVLGNAVEAFPEALQTNPLESLHDAIQEAARGNSEARKLIETNARTDVIERTMKSGHVMKIDLMVDEAGRIQQHGQTLESVQANSLRYAADSWQMRERTEAETRNAFRMEQLHRAGTLDDYNFVVLSRAADNMNEEQMKNVGFFTETMSCAIQITSAENGRLTTESAFVSGVKTDGEARHDQQTAVSFGEHFSVDLSGKSAAEILDTPLLIHKSLMPDGAVDLVKIWDEAAGGTFFGEDKPKQDYLEYKQICKEREQRFAPKVEKIVQQLISKASSIHSPVEATERLGKISEEQMIEQAIGDSDIDPRVFGPAAINIERARLAYYNGDAEQLVKQVQIAKANAQSSSCPGAGSSSAETNEISQNSSEDCEFVSKECPMCHTKNVKTRVTKTRISGSCGCSKSK